jgi:hypothetical protein
MIRPRDRITIAIALGLWGAFIAYFALAAAPEHMAKDFSWPYRAARALLDHQDPYRVIQPTGAYPFNTPLLYPLPAALVALPFVPFRPPVAGALFFGVCSALLAYGLMRDGFARLPLFASAPFCMAGVLVQWSPLITAAALLPSLQFLMAAKPNLGVASFVYRPTWRGLIGGVVFVLLSVIVLPHWPFEWRDALRTAPRYRGPATHLVGLFLLLGAVRWRRPEGRLFLAMSLVPQLSLFYDQLPLWLIPNTVWRSLGFSALSWVAWWQWYPHRALSSSVAAAEPWILWLVYLPALLLLLLLPARDEKETAADGSAAA